ncbi:MAG: hypothetical protein AAB929_06245, partial [Patescibacteria group bacterium]
MIKPVIPANLPAGRQGPESRLRCHSRLDPRVKPEDDGLNFEIYSFVYLLIDLIICLFVYLFIRELHLTSPS